MSLIEAVQDGNVVNLLWTGGWDSTFRLMSLIVNYECLVQPFYIIIPGLPSWKIEIETTKKIMEACAKDGTKYKGRILPPIVIDGTKFPVDSELEAKYQALRRLARLGTQYIWLEYFVKDSGVKNLELSIHRDDIAHTLLAGHVIQKAGFPTGTYVLDPNADRNLTLFEGFEFPLFDVTKTQMEEVARQQGFSEIMEMTWFCHRPVNGRYACGTCNPCRFAMTEGMSRRVGWRGRLRYNLHRQWTRIPEGVRRVLEPYVEKAWPRLRADQESGT